MNTPFSNLLAFTHHEDFRRWLSEYHATAGRAVLPGMSEHGFVIVPDILVSFQANPHAWTDFLAMPPLYQRVRIDAIQRDRSDMNRFNARLQRLIDSAAQGKLIGNGMTMVGFSRYKSSPLISPSRLLSKQSTE